MQVSNSASNTNYSSRQMLSAWCPEISSRSLLWQLQESVQARLTVADRQSDADFQLIDWRSDFPKGDCSVSGNSKNRIDSTSLPILIVIDEKSDLTVRFESYSQVDFSNYELINVAELNTDIADFRIRKLLESREVQCAQHGNTEAEIILQTVMKHSNDWIVVKDLDNRFKYVSGKFCRAYNKTAEEIVGKNDLQLGTPPELVFGKPGAEWKGYWALDKKVTDSGIAVSNAPLLMDEELNMYESMDKVPLRNSSGDVFALVVSVYRFIKNSAKSKSTDDFDEDGKSTHLWDRKQSLPNNPALFSINNERIKAEELKHESDRAFIAKNRFIAAASHDLRQPLHALGLCIGALQPYVDKNGKALVGKVEDCISALSELLASLLDISKLDANVVTADMSDFEIESLLQSLRTECLSIARGKSLEINCSADESIVYSDEVLLRRVIRNLLINAINYTVQGKISLTARKIGNQVEVVVEDSGIGIPRHHQKLVFEEFVKSESNSADIQQGLGLGLSIVKRLCNILNIQLKLDSEVGRGTRVSLAIPLGKNNDVESDKEIDSLQPGPASQAHSLAVAEQKKILVIDDDLTVCEAVETVLVQSGYQVISATSTDNALAMLRESPALPDAMIVDFRLSKKMTGLDAIEFIFAELQTSIPALIVTGDTTGKGLLELTSSGYRHLHKPVEAGRLLEMLHDAVDSFRE